MGQRRALSRTTVEATQITELWTDWTTKTDGAVPTVGDEGRPITFATGGVGTAAMAIESGGIVQPGTGAGYLLQTTSGSKKIRRIGCTFTFTATSDGAEVMAVCAFLNTTISPQQASIHVVTTKSSWSIQAYDGSVVQIKTGNYATALSNLVEYRMEVVLIGTTLYCTFPDGTVAQGTEARVGSINGVAACWEIVQTNATKGIKLLRSWADDLPDRVIGASEPRIGQIARRAFPSLFYDDATGNIGIGGAAAGFAPLWVPGTIAAFKYYIDQAPTAATDATRKDYVDRLTSSTITSTKTAAYTAVSGEMVMVDAASGPITITLPNTSTGGPIRVKKLDASANVVTIAAAAGQTIGVQAAATTALVSQYQVAEVRPGPTANNWVITDGQLSITGLDARYRTPPRTATAGATYSLDGTAAGNMSLTCTDNTVITPTGTPTHDRMLLVECLASGAARTPSIASSVVMVGVTSRSVALSAAGKVALFGLRYSALRGAWELIATGAEA